MNQKFEFDVEHQWEIIKYILLDRDGYKAIQILKSDAFTLIEQQLVIETLKIFFKKKGRIPKNPINLIYELTKVYKTKKFANTLKESDLDDLKKKIKSMYKSNVVDGADILENCKTFASYIQVKRILEDFDISNYSGYVENLNKLQNAVSIGKSVEEEKTLTLVDGWKQRQLRRKLDSGSIPTPVKYINKSTNSGGYPKGSLITIIDKGKGGKTSFLVNIGRGYMRLRKKVLVIDLENGAYAYATRFDQSIIKCKKDNLIDEKSEDRLSKVYRKYARLGCEVVIQRFPAGTTANQIDAFMEDLYSRKGIKFQVVIIDYIGIMGSNAGKTEDDNKRISDAYVDCKNLCEKWDLDIIWTGHHVNREGEKRRAYKYEPNDTAKCIDIHRHVDAMWGINQNADEKRAGVFRLEVVDQRDGVGDWRVFFWGDISTQRWDEFSKTQMEEYQAQTGNSPEYSQPKKDKPKSMKGTNTDI